MYSLYNTCSMGKYIIVVIVHEEDLCKYMCKIVIVSLSDNLVTDIHLIASLVFVSMLSFH